MQKYHGRDPQIVMKDDEVRSFYTDGHIPLMRGNQSNAGNLGEGRWG